VSPTAERKLDDARQKAQRTGAKSKAFAAGQVEPRPFRAFQGWRYLAAKDAPRDLDRAAPGAKDMPEALRRELRDLGLL